MSIETATVDRGESRTAVTYAGKTSVRTGFDPKAFARVLIMERRLKKTGFRDRVARQAEMEATLVGRN